jgi:hypothetical protein
MRVTLEKVDGEYQGACYPFMRRDELRGSNRLIFHESGPMFVGITDRGWSRGSTGLQKITWTGKAVFDIKQMSLTKDGFELTFTQPVDEKLAADPRSYNLTTWHYKYGRQYGSPEIDKQPVKITKIAISEDKTKATLTVEDLKDHQQIYYLTADNVRTPTGQPLRNKEAYYTLNRFRK